MAGKPLVIADLKYTTGNVFLEADIFSQQHIHGTGAKGRCATSVDVKDCQDGLRIAKCPFLVADLALKSPRSGKRPRRRVSYALWHSDGCLTLSW